MGCAGSVPTKTVKVDESTTKTAEVVLAARSSSSEKGSIQELDAEHRRTRLAKGVAESLLVPTLPQQPAPAGAVRVMQWNVLADGLSDDGFLVQDILEASGAEPNDPSAAGRQADLRACSDAVASARAKGDEDGLKTLQAQLGTDRQRRNHEATVAWECRWPLIKAKIAASAPHVICLQELDHLADAIVDLGALGYVCGPPGAKYVPAHTVSGCAKRSEDAYDPAAFLSHLESVGLAFAPKVPSTCRELSRKRAGGEAADDDGVAIFWRASLFEMERLAFLSQPDKTRSQGAVLVKLRSTAQGTAAPTSFSVLSAHLPSGASAKDMASRHTVLSTPSCVKTSATELTGPSLCEWFAHAAGDAPTIWCMDSNAAPNHASGSPAWLAVMQSCEAVGGVRSVWEPFFDVASGDAIEGVLAPATVNKMRGPLSGQARKIGEHHCEVIDQIFVAPKACVERLDFVRPPLVYAGEDAARAELMPSLSVPSDHACVIVDVTFAS